MLEKYFDLSSFKIRKCNEIDRYPKLKEREKWDGLPEETKKTFIAEAEKYLNYQYPALLAMNYLKLYTEDSRKPYMDPYYSRREVLTKLVIAECIENKGRFMSDIVNGIYLICEETTWLDPAHNLTDYAVNTSRKDILPNRESEMLDLSLANTAGVLSWVYYLMKDALDEISPLISRNIELTMDERVFSTYLKRNDIWWLTFGNNWNMHMNTSIAIAASLLINDENKLKKILEKALWSVDCYYKEYPYDGGCEEGTAYWHANVGHNFLEWIKYITYGKVDAFKEQQVKNIADYERNMYVGENNYVSVSDSHVNFEKQNTDNLFRIGMLVGNENLKIMAAKRGRSENKNQTSISEILDRFFNDDCNDEFEKYKNREVVFEKSVWYDSTETAIWREKNCEGGLFFTIKGGNNEELHNHSDVGNFALFNDCEPVIIDAGIGEYSNTAFSPQRYTIWFFNSKFHNVPYIGDVEQKNEDKECKARNVVHTENSVSMDLAPAYRDESVIKWIRNVEYDRKNNELVFDEHYELSEEKQIDLHFMTAEKVRIEDGRILFPQGIEMHYENLAASVEEVENNDEVIREHWGKVYRLKLRTHGKCGNIHYVIKKK